MRDVASLYRNLKADRRIVPLYLHFMIITKSSVENDLGG